MFSFTDIVGTSQRDAPINNIRRIKRVVQKRIYSTKTKPYLKNGDVTAVILCYVGHFRRDNKITTQDILDYFAITQLGRLLPNPPINT